MKFFFIVTFIILIFVNTVKAQMVNFNCNFIEGGQSEGAKIILQKRCKL